MSFHQILADRVFRPVFFREIAKVKVKYHKPCEFEIGNPLEMKTKEGVKAAKGYNGYIFSVSCGDDMTSYAAKFIEAQDSPEKERDIFNEIKNQQRAADAGLAPNIYEYRLYKGKGMIQCTIIMDRMVKNIDELELEDSSEEFKYRMKKEVNSLVEKLHHEVGIFHGDLAKKNIMMGQDGKLKLIDFGESKVYEGKNENYSLRPRRTKSRTKKSKKKKSRTKKSMKKSKKKSRTKKSDKI